MSDNGQKPLELPGSISVRDLAIKMNTSPIQLIKSLMANGVMATINQQIDYDTAAIVASELGFVASLQQLVADEEKGKTPGSRPAWRKLIDREDPAKLVSRPPVVTILGHVDHGKTTLLDAIRHTSIVAGEFGGITQHIGAYQVEHNGQLITFLDTPGHAAFSAMRARGAAGADIVVLVVAADDGVKPQTREAIDHARSAEVPIIVALNKMDKPDANPDLVKKQLADLGLVPDEWDGNTIVVPVSAKKGTGLEDLMQAILLIAENTFIKANPNGEVIGTVVEAEVDRSKGVMATLLVQNGSLETGDVVQAGMSYGKIRAMFDFRGKKVRKAAPSTPVQVMGLSGCPSAGDVFHVHPSEREARSVVEGLINQSKLDMVPEKNTLESLQALFKTGNLQELCLVVKADVQGSLEPIVNSLNELDQSDIKIKFLRAQTGGISEDDIMLAATSNGIVIGFNVDADPAARRKADAEGVSIRLYNIIYRITEDIEKALKGMLEPEYVDVVAGKAEILALFHISKIGTIAGCKVLQGEVRRNTRVRVLRGTEKVYDGELSSLKHEKEDVREVRTGFECGMAFKGFNDVAVGDIVEAYTKERVGG